MKTFLISDTHFGHVGMTKFLREDGTKLRPWDNIQDHDQNLIECWNEVVKPGDKVYHLGDVGLSNATHLLRVMQSLNGTKILIKGNHDSLKMSQYAQVFKDVRACHSLNGIFLAHIPIHPMSLERWKGQAHGHLHAKTVGDERYMNVSCEQIDYTPIDFEEVNEYFKTL